jgi:hypothetical protein
VVGAGDILVGAGSARGNNPLLLARGEFIDPALSVANVVRQIGRAQITSQQNAAKKGETDMNSIFYIVGVIVVVLFVAGYLGLR